MGLDKLTDIFAGIDIGSSTTKAVLIDGGKNLLEFGILPSGISLQHARDTALSFALKGAGLKREQIKRTVTTGFGRNMAGIDGEKKTEIICHARGCYHYFPLACTIVDIGGQDTKIIKLDETGKLINFKMNRKCAAGTGTFLEEIAHRMNVPLDEMDRLARDSTKKIRLNSYCTVFSTTEILTRIREGETTEDMINGAFEAVVQRVLEMDSLEGTVVMTGGVVAHNKIVVEIVERQLSRKVNVPPYPQLTGALGAAIIASES
jgi:predicted CoA-substrate-specific enzyme activase